MAAKLIPGKSPKGAWNIPAWTASAESISSEPAAKRRLAVPLLLIAAEPWQ